MEDSTPDSVDSLLIVPHLSLVKFNHNVERSTRSIFIGVLKESLDELLKFLVDVMLLGGLVHQLKIRDDHTVQE